ncbi:hypothetical protein ACFYE8_12345 [Rhizobium leguminosarum]|uniref:hypothetical protein n=1 Tax=Rhizobium leguminosarum TaxID=384 RepID=UPI0036DD2E20
MVGQRYSLLGFMFLAGCTSVPTLDDAAPQSLGDLANMVKCQTLKAFQTLEPKSTLDLSQWYVTFTITKKTKETAGVGLDPLDWVIPSNIDKLVFHGGASASRVSTRNATVGYTQQLSEPYTIICAEASSRPLTVTPIDFKVGEWARQVSTAGTEPDSFGYTIDVVMTLDAYLSSDVADGHFSATGGVNGEREATRTIDFAFSQAPNPRGAPVFVTNFPGELRVGSEKRKTKETRKGGAAQTPEAPAPAAVIQQNRAILQQLQIDRIDRAR